MASKRIPSTLRMPKSAKMVEEIQLKIAAAKMSAEESVLWLKSQPHQAELVKACFFDDPLLAAAERYHASTEWQAVRAFIGPPRGTALDLGAGRGISSFALAKDGWSTVALEPGQSGEVGAGAIRRLATEARVRIEVKEAWGESLPFEDSSFDLVYCRQLLHHARNLPQLCREAARVLKPKGTFIATREHVLSHTRDLELFLSAHPLHHMNGSENAFLLEQYTSAITSAGIDLSKVLNTLESNINLYPETVETLKVQIARKLRIPSGSIPTALLSWRGKRMDTPGRLYTFVGRKRINA